MVLQQLCGWTENKNGRVICATVATIGGLHLFLTPPQNVLGFLPKFSFEFMGREMGAQQLVGGVLTVCGVCALGACCL